MKNVLKILLISLLVSSSSSTMLHAVAFTDLIGVEYQKAIGLEGIEKLNALLHVLEKLSAERDTSFTQKNILFTKTQAKLSQEIEMLRKAGVDEETEAAFKTIQAQADQYLSDMIDLNEKLVAERKEIPFHQRLKSWTLKKKWTLAKLAVIAAGLYFAYPPLKKWYDEQNESEKRRKISRITRSRDRRIPAEKGAFIDRFIAKPGKITFERFGTSSYTSRGGNNLKLALSDSKKADDPLFDEEIRTALEGLHTLSLRMGGRHSTLDDEDLITMSVEDLTELATYLDPIIKKRAQLVQEILGAKRWRRIAQALRDDSSFKRIARETSYYRSLSSEIKDAVERRHDTFDPADMISNYDSRYFLAGMRSSSLAGLYLQARNMRGLGELLAAYKQDKGGITGFYARVAQARAIVSSSDYERRNNTYNIATELKDYMNNEGYFFRYATDEEKAWADELVAIFGRGERWFEYKWYDTVTPEQLLTVYENVPKLRQALIRTHRLDHYRGEDPYWARR